MGGVKDFVTASDIPAGGVNCWSGDLAGVPGSQYDKEKIFFEVNDTIPYVGAQIGVIAAETWAQALARARAVKQWYSIASPAVNKPQGCQEARADSVQGAGGVDTEQRCC